MKKILLRFLGTICILASVATIFLTTWIQIDGVRTKAFRTAREIVYTELDSVHNRLINSLDTYLMDQTIKEELKDYDLPYTKTGIKKRINEVRDIFRELFDDSISFGEILKLSLKAPQFIEDTGNILSSSILRRLVYASTIITVDGLEDFIDEADSYSWCITAVTVALFAVMLLGIAAAVFNMMDKANALKHIYLCILIVIVGGLMVALPLATEVIDTMMVLPEEWEDISLKLTVMPFLTAILALTPCVINVLVRTKTKKEKQTNE